MKNLIGYIYGTGEKIFRNKIDSDETRKQVFEKDGYKEISFDSAIGAKFRDRILIYNMCRFKVN